MSHTVLISFGHTSRYRRQAKERLQRHSLIQESSSVTAQTGFLGADTNLKDHAESICERVVYIEEESNPYPI